MYSLGCLTYAVHSKGDAPFKNFGNLGSIRDNAGRPVPRMDRFDRDLQCPFLFLHPIHSTLKFNVHLSLTLMCNVYSDAIHTDHPSTALPTFA